MTTTLTPKEHADQWLFARVQEETGEVDLHGCLKILGWSEVPEQLSDDQFNQVVYEIGERRRKAAFHRERGEQLAKPYDKSGDFWQNTFKPLLDAYFLAHQKRKKDGSLDGKTMECRGGRLKYTGVKGGWSLAKNFGDWIKSARNLWVELQVGVEVKQVEEYTWNEQKVIDRIQILLNDKTGGITEETQLILKSLISYTKPDETNKLVIE